MGRNIIYHNILSIKKQVSLAPQRIYLKYKISFPRHSRNKSILINPRFARGSIVELGSAVAAPGRPKSPKRVCGPTGRAIPAFWWERLAKKNKAGMDVCQNGFGDWT